MPKLRQFTPPTRNTQGNIEDKRGKHTAGLAKAARQSALILSRQNMRYLFFFLITIFNTPNCLLALGMYAGQFDWPVAVSTSGISGATN